MANIRKEPIGNLCREYYVEYGKEVNGNRALPLLMDGLKPVYRRAIYAALNAPGNHIKSLDLVGSIAKVHPHSDKSIIRVINALVRNRVFKELGNFGFFPIYGVSSPAAAPRYTETGIEDNWYEIFSKLIDQVPYVEGEVEGVMEPEYLPTCLPLSLIFGSQGIGIGINNNTPSFSPQSLLDAYENDDPSLLKPYYDLEIDYEKSDLQRLWDHGVGKVIYKYHMEQGYDASGRECVRVWGDTQLFTPNWDHQIEMWRSQGLVTIGDESTGGKYCITVARNKGVRKIDLDMIWEECQYCCSTYGTFEEIQTIYRLGIHDRTLARYISIKEWIDTVYQNYIRLIEQYKSSNLSKLDFEELVVSYMRQVAEILMNTKKDITNQQIADKLGIDVEVVNAITRKSIGTLKRVDVDKELRKIQERRDYYRTLDPNEFVKSIIAKM